MKIPFDIKYRPQIESGEYKVVIYMGNSPTEECSVEILKWDSNSDAGCIVGCFQVKGKDKLYVFDKNGEHKVSGIEGNRLFIITPEPEFTEFEEAVAQYLDGKRLIVDAHIQEDAIKTIAAKLLELARKELVPIFGAEYMNGYEDGVNYGRAEALKDLPKWRKWGNGACGNERGIPIAIVKRWLNGYELVDALGIQGEQYIMLSDLEKLPGFKED